MQIDPASSPQAQPRDEQPDVQLKQEHYRDARFSGQYDSIWQTVGKCVFCDLRDKYIIFEEDGVVMTVSLFAYIDGHVMIVPRRHVRSPKELTQREWDTVRKFTYIAKKLIKQVHGVRGMQVVQKDGSNAQSTVDQHLHFHCIPFDSPDLSVWNYRHLKYTPLQNAGLYRAAGKNITSSGMRFEQRYHRPDGLPMYCDLVLLSGDGRVLLEERSDHAQTIPPHWTLPGGRVENYTRSLEEELVREVREETGLDITPSTLTLLASRISDMTYERRSLHLDAQYSQPVRFFWNTYVLRGFDAGTSMQAGDDSAALHWVPFAEAIEHPMLTVEVKATLRTLRNE